MEPVLFDLPGWGPINAYGTAVLLAGLLTLPGLYWELRDRGLGDGRPGSMVVDLYLVLVIGGTLGGRLLHILTAPGPYLEQPARLVQLDNTGFVYFGFLMATVGGFAWVARRYGNPIASVYDAASPWMPLGHAIGRVGCLLAGCCFGAPTDAPWSLRFGPEAVAFGAGEVPRVGDHTVPLHPTQVYESVGLFVLFAGLLVLRRRRGIEPPWRAASRYLVGYGLLRLVTELFRGDRSRGFLLEWRAPDLAGALGLPLDQPLLLSASQAIALGMIALGIVGLRRRPRPDPPDASAAPAPRASAPTSDAAPKLDSLQASPAARSRPEPAGRVPTRT